MESLQEAINPCFFGDNLDLQLIEQGFTTTNTTQHDLRFEDEVEAEEEEEEEELEEAQYISAGLEDNRMPFLQMLQSINDFPPNSSTTSDYFSSSKEPSFQALLRLQHFNKYSQINSLDALESCVTQETHQQQQLHDSPPKSEDRQLQTNNPLEVSSLKMSPHHRKTQFIAKSGATSTPVAATRERRKRKRTRPAKNKEELESQRMTHIAVERNRRRQMNDHLGVLRSLMPPSYIQRGDQASIVGGAIDFVKELEQHLQTLEAHKTMRGVEQGFVTNNVDDPSNNSMTTTTTSSNSPSSSSAVSTMPSNGMFMSLSQCKIGSNEEGINNNADGITAQNKSEAAEVDVTVIETHVNLKVQCQKRLGQLVRALDAFEDIRLTVLHLNITSAQDKVLYFFNLKIEEGCKLGSADEIARAVHQIFSFINGS